MAEADLRDCPSCTRLMEIVSDKIGLDDFGDTARNHATQAFLESLGEEVWPTMTMRARQIAINFVQQYLASRLRLIADRKIYEPIRAQSIRQPLIIVGPRHSGTTLLHTLLSLDPDNRAPELRFCRAPSPPFALGDAAIARMNEVDQRITDLFALIPGFFISHPYMIDEAAGRFAECGSNILNMVSTSEQMWWLWGGESYRHYLLDADHTAAIGFHHDFLQHAQWGRSGKRWVLKGSDHMLWMSELAMQYPDAKLIWTHRDLSEQLSLLANAQSTLFGLRGHPVTPNDRRTQGRRAVDHQLACINKAMRCRDQIGEHAFVDVSYHALLETPPLYR